MVRKKLTEIKNIENSLNNYFIKLIELKSPEYAIGVLESLKCGYLSMAMSKVIKENEQKNKERI